MDLKQFEKKILHPTLVHIQSVIPYSYTGELLTGETIWHESDGLKYIQQLGDGPGYGICMMEEPTWYWLVGTSYANVEYRRGVKIRDCNFEDLLSDWSLGVAMCRLRYYVVKESLPDLSLGVQGRASYWGRYYQTQNDPIKIKDYLVDAAEMAKARL